MGMVREGEPSPVEQWWFLCWELGGSGTCRLLGLHSFLSSPDLLDCLVPHAAIWDLQLA